MKSLFMNKIGSPKLIITAVILFLLVRITIIFFGSPDFFCESELMRGTMALEIMNNFNRPLLSYQSEVHTGGTLVASLIIIPFFKLFGENLITIKMIGLIFSLLTLLCIYYFVAKCMKKSMVALLVLFWFVFATPLYAVYSTVFLGEHYASQFFSFLVLIIFFKLTESNLYNKKNVFLSFLFGVICGFSIYFSYTFLITFLTCLVVWFLIDRVFFFRKQFLFFFVGFVIGILPRILFEYNFNQVSLGIRGTSIFGHITLNPAILLERLIFWITFYLPRGFWMGDIGDVKKFPLLGVLLCVIFVVAYGYLFNKVRACAQDKTQIHQKRAFLLILTYPIIFFLMHLTNDYSDKFMHFPLRAYDIIDDYTEFKYTFSLYPFVIITIAVFFYDLFVLIKNVYMRLFLILLSLLFGVSSVFALLGKISLKNYEMSNSRWKPYSYDLIAEQIVRMYPDKNMEEIISYFKKIEPQYQKRAYLGFGLTFDEYNDNELVNQALNLIPKNQQKNFVRGIGAACADYLVTLERPMSVSLSCPIFLYIPENLQIYFYQGIGFSAAMFDQQLQFLEVTEENLVSYYQGSAIGMLRLYKGNLERLNARIDLVPSKYQTKFVSYLTQWDEYFMEFRINKDEVKKYIRQYKWIKESL